MVAEVVLMQKAQRLEAEALAAVRLALLVRVQVVLVPLGKEIKGAIVVQVLQIMERQEVAVLALLGLTGQVVLAATGVVEQHLLIVVLVLLMLVVVAEAHILVEQ
jgi:hypothetical protein